MKRKCVNVAVNNKVRIALRVLGSVCRPTECVEYVLYVRCFNAYVLNGCVYSDVRGTPL
jgi:hypothetical protein